MAVRIIGSSWWVDFRFEHARYRKRSPENSKAGAKAYETSLRYRLASGEKLDQAEVREPTFEEFSEAWFSNYVVSNNKPSEQNSKRYILRESLVPFFGKKPISAIGRKDIELYKASEQRKGIGNKTINNKLAVLRKCLATAHDWDVLRSAPPCIKALKCPPPKTDFLTSEEADRLLASAESAVHEMILMALRTGLRQGELRGLQWESIDWENRVLTVRHSLCDYARTLISPKSNRERHVPLSSDLYEMLAVRRQETGYVFTNKRGGPFKSENHLRILKQVQEKAGLRKFGWHTLRHTFASHLAMKGVPLRTVQELLGHSTITMTMRYAHVTASNLRAAIDMLNVQNGQPAGNVPGLSLNCEINAC